MTNRELVDRLHAQGRLAHGEWVQLLDTFTPEDRAYAAELARSVAQREFGRSIYFRGIIEFTSICKTTATTAASGAPIAARRATA